VNDYVWVKKAAAFGQSLEAMAGEQQPVTWGVFPLVGPDGLYVRWNGGGGIGDPLQREPAQVLTDVIQNTVSERAAADLYGVIIRNGAVDKSGTEERRRSLREERSKMVVTA
jgi:N-methylhydantoinase B